MKSGVTKEQIRERYTGAQGYDYHHTTHNTDSFVYEVVSHERAHKLQPFIRPEDEVLEFGAGIGLNIVHLQCKRRVAYELSDIGRTLCESAGVEYVTDLGMLVSQSFSVIICHHVLEHVPDPFEVLGQILSYLKPGGRLLLYVPFERLARHREYKPGDPNQHLFSWNALSLGNLVAATGFQVSLVRIQPFGYEQRLAFLTKYHPGLYRLGLGLVRKLRPTDEVFLLANKPPEEIG